MNIDRLFLRAIYVFLEKNEQRTIQWEDVVKSCFELFPETFSFEKYNEWPDTWKIHNCMWRCRNQRQWIMGDAKVGISLTEIGKTIGSVKLEDKSFKDVAERKVGIGTDPRLLNYIKESSLFKQYLNDPKNFFPGESEIRGILKATMETDEKTLNRNLEYLKKVIKDYGKTELISFGECLHIKLKELLSNE
jgi:hypothetical protein